MNDTPLACDGSCRAMNALVNAEELSRESIAPDGDAMTIAMERTDTDHLADPRFSDSEDVLSEAKSVTIDHILDHEARPVHVTNEHIDQIAMTKSIGRRAFEHLRLQPRLSVHRGQAVGRTRD